MTVVLIAGVLVAALGVAVVWARSGADDDESVELERMTTEALTSEGSEVSASALELLGNAEITKSQSSLALDDECASVLADYEGLGGCVVARDGYLDLAGKTWGCVVQGEGWVEICLVQESAEGGSERVVWRMDASDVPEELVAGGETTG